MDSVNFGLSSYLDYFACPLIIAQKKYFDYSGRKLFINSVINSVILVSLSIIHRHVPSELSDYFVFTVCEIHFSGFIEALDSKGILLRYAKRGITSAPKCADVAGFTFAT